MLLSGYCFSILHSGASLLPFFFSLIIWLTSPFCILDSSSPSSSSSSLSLLPPIPRPFSFVVFERLVLGDLNTEQIEALQCEHVVKTECPRPRARTD